MIWTKNLIRFLWKYGIAITCVVLIGVTAFLSNWIKDYDQGIGIGTPAGDFKFTASLGFFHYRFFEQKKRGHWDVARIYGNAFQYRDFNSEQNASKWPRIFVLKDHLLRNHGITVRYRHAILILGFVAIGSLIWGFFKDRNRRIQSENSKA